MNQMLKGWKEIAGCTPFCADTIRRNYRKKLVQAGVLFFAYCGRPRRKTPCAYSQDLTGYFKNFSNTQA
jgi:hypothetical protein